MTLASSKVVRNMDCRQRLESYLREQGIEFEVTRPSPHVARDRSTGV